MNLAWPTEGGKNDSVPFLSIGFLGVLVFFPFVGTMALLSDQALATLLEGQRCGGGEFSCPSCLTILARPAYNQPAPKFVRDPSLKQQTDHRHMSLPSEDRTTQLTDRLMSNKRCLLFKLWKYFVMHHLLMVQVILLNNVM